MRPLYLEMTAFGPFAGAESVDFGQLADNRLFLICGETGSGKTSILDGICFALFGCASGAARSKPSELRSDHARDDVETKVTFDFALGSRAYRVTRTPSQSVAKKRGQRLTDRKATAELVELKLESGEWILDLDARPLASKPNEADARVTELLGLNSDQFRQVVVLPQGEFERFLTCGSDEREEILARLFGTERLRRFQLFLKQRAGDLQQECDSARLDIQRLLDNSGCTSLEELNSRLAQEGGELAEAEKAMLQAQEACHQARRALEEGRSAQQKLKALHAAKSTAAEIDRLRPAMEKLGDKCEWARKAMGLKGSQQIRARLRQEVNAARAAKGLCEKQHREAASASELAKSQLAAQLSEDSERQRKEAQARVQELDALRPQLAALEEITVDARAKAKQVEELEQEVRRLSADVDALIQKEGVCVQSLAQLEQAAAGLEGLKQTAARINELRYDRVKLQQAFIDQAKAKEEHGEAEVAVASARESVKQAELNERRLNLQWHQGQAAVLAATLQEDAPCPVCGSLEHPNPCISEADLPGDIQLEAANTEVRAARQAFDVAQANLLNFSDAKARAETSVQELTERLAEYSELSIEELDAQVQEAQERSDAAAQAASQAEDVRLELDSVRVELDGAQQRLAALSTNLNASRTAAERTKAIREDRQSKIPPELSSLTALEGALEEAELRSAALAGALDVARQTEKVAVQELSRAEEALRQTEQQISVRQLELQSAEDRFTSELSAAGFSDEGHFETALMDEADLERAQGELEDFANRNHTAVARLREAAETSQGIEEPDLPALEEGERAAAEGERNAIRTHAKLSNLLGQLTTTLNRVRELEALFNSLESRYGVLGKLSQLANGNLAGRDRITFQRFALAWYLERVLEAASIRLLLMSDHRYTLARSGKAANLQNAAGLELEVADNWTGESRPAAYLSGGEKFIAALALALGLSDVVQQDAAVRKLDTIFIDEGFGHLDPESLDRALDVLGMLQSDGRLVGVISHVGSMQERIPARLVVQKSRQGSRLTVQA